MIDSITLAQVVTSYQNECKERQTRPTYTGLGYKLRISGQTVGNVNKGRYNGKIYGEKESSQRCISNTDFDVIQDLYR